METRAKPPPSKRPPKASGRPNEFQTEPKDVRPLLPFLPKNKIIWEPAQGEGQIVAFLHGMGYNVVGTDILNGFDFLSPLAAPPAFDIIVTNPPYSIKDQWLERCFALEKPFALFLPITIFDSKERRALFKRYKPQFLMPDDRPTFTTPSGKKGGSWFYCTWICWQFDLPDRITYAEAA